jgi:hypothetical protein
MEPCKEDFILLDNLLEDIFVVFLCFCPAAAAPDHGGHGQGDQSAERRRRRQITAVKKARD